MDLAQGIDKPVRDMKSREDRIREAAYGRSAKTRVEPACAGMIRRRTFEP